jgi:hypothetical protein
MPIGETNVDGHQDVSSLVAVLNSSGEFVFIQGIDFGSYAAMPVVDVAGLGSSRKIATKSVAVTNGNTVDFELDTDADGDALPTDMEIQAIIIRAHDGASPPVAVSNRWKFTMYTHSDREVDDYFYERDGTTFAASNNPFVLNVAWGYLNEEGSGEIPCSLYIETGDTDATFTVKVIFA